MMIVIVILVVENLTPRKDGRKLREF